MTKTRIRWNTQKVREEMAKEKCILLDDYKRGDIRIHYLYEGNEFSVRWSDWMKKDRPSRPHLKGGNRKITKSKSVDNLNKTFEDPENGEEENENENEEDFNEIENELHQE